jgi:hypothetical protein
MNRQTNKGQDKMTDQRIGNAWVIVAIIEASEAIGIDPRTANIADCCAIADKLGQREGIKATGRAIDPAKVAAILKGAF